MSSRIFYDPDLDLGRGDGRRVGQTRDWVGETVVLTGEERPGVKGPDIYSDDLFLQRVPETQIVLP